MALIEPLPEPEGLAAIAQSNILGELGYRRLSQRRFARALGVSEQSFSDKLRGKTRLTLDDLDQIAGLLDVDPAELLTRRGRGGTPLGGGRGGGALGLPRLDSNQQPSD